MYNYMITYLLTTDEYLDKCKRYNSFVSRNAKIMNEQDIDSVKKEIAKQINEPYRHTPVADYQIIITYIYECSTTPN